MQFLKNLILKSDGKLSWSKFWLWFAGLSGVLTQLTQQLTEAGIVIPAVLIPYIKTISIASAIYAGVRLRNAAGTTITSETTEKK